MSTYQEFANKKSSEKITVVHLHGKAYLYTFSAYSGDVYVKTVPHFVSNLDQNEIALTRVDSPASVISGTYHFDPSTNELYIYSLTPTSDEFVVEYRFFYANAPINLTWDLSEDGVEVLYEPRLLKNVPFSTVIDASNVGTALVGTGAITLQNTDLFFDSFYGKLVWDQQQFNSYSLGRELDTSNAKMIYDGIITEHSYTDKQLTFKVKNKLNVLKRDISSTLYSEDHVNIESLPEGIESTYQSRVWGRVNGLQMQNVSSLNGDTFTMTGTTTVAILSAGVATITGTSTIYLTEVSIGDTLTFEAGTVTVTRIDDDTTLLGAYDDVDFAEIDSIITNTTKYVPSTFNRTFMVSAKALRETITTVVSNPFATVFEIDDVQDLEIGDLVEFEISSSFYTRTIVGITNQRITINQSLPVTANFGDTIIRPSVQRIYYLGASIDHNRENYTINNTTTGCFVTLSATFEELVPEITSQFPSQDFISDGQVRVLIEPANDNVQNVIKPNDFIKFGANPYVKVSGIIDDFIYHRDSGDVSVATYQGLTLKTITPITSTSVLSCDVIGETEDGTKTGVWVKTAPQFIKQQLIESGFTGSINTESFDIASQESNYAISLSAPESPKSGSMPSVKSYIDKINQSIAGTLIINDDFKFQYSIVDFSLDFATDLKRLEVYDAISWSPKSEPNDLYSLIQYTYNAKQIDPVSEDAIKDTVTAVSEVAQKITGVDETLVFNSTYSTTNGANQAAQRRLILSESMNTVITVKGSLNLSDFSMGETIFVDFPLAGNFGDIVTQGRIMTVTTVKNDGESITLVLSDIANLYTKRCIITPNDAPDYSVASEYEILLYSWVTDDNGIVDGNDDSKGRNILI